MEPGRTKHQRRYPEPVPDELEDNPQAIAVWRARKAAEWEEEHARMLERMRVAKERRQSWLFMTPDALMLACSMLPPLDMYMLYEVNMGEPRQPGETDFRAWCNRTHVEDFDGVPQEKANIWDVLLAKNFPQAGTRDPKISGDQRR